MKKNTSHITNMSSCDSQGSVLITDNAAYRRIKKSHKESVLNILKSIDSMKVNGIIQTQAIISDEIFNNIIEPSDALILKHRRIDRISYPHEWCATMLKDAALFHLELSEQLLGIGLFLKDAHPWNILFENGSPIFVDFTSIVTRDSLFSEEYIQANKSYRNSEPNIHLAFVFKEIFERMYLPYFINPLCFYAFGQRTKARKTIENTTLNSSTEVISFLKCLPAPSFKLSTVTGIFKLLISRLRVNKIIKQLLENKDISKFFLEMRQLVIDINVTVTNSPYSVYYKLKEGYNDWIYSENWNSKQKNVYNYLNTSEINTVLDVACNTGWFAVMAEKLGKNVIAFDIDEGCIELLYNQVKKDQLNILPLVINFTELTKDHYSIHDGKKVLINAEHRLRSDSVIALGIIHHLTLGLGLSLEEVLDRLIPLCRKLLIIEFVDTADTMIQNEPAFFPAYFQNEQLSFGYNLDRLILLCEKRGFKVKCELSHPSTRTLLICQKLPTI